MEEIEAPQSTISYSKAGYFKQTYVLLKKIIKVVFRKLGFLLGHISTVLLVCLVITTINYLTRYSYENEPSMTYPINDVGNIRKCTFDPTCSSFGYIIMVRHQFLFLILGRRKTLGRLHYQPDGRKVGPIKGKRLYKDIPGR